MAPESSSLTPTGLTSPDHPEASVSAESVHAQIRQLLLHWNRTTREYPRESTIQEVFEVEAARRPEAVALIAGEERMTYRELSERSEHLASQLVEAGVVVGSKVAVCLERSPELIVALLGILKAGGAYVPLSPEYPVERLEWMLEDTQAPVLLTEQSLSGRLPVTKARVLLKEEWSLEPATAKAHPGRLKVDGMEAMSLAYVMYTSGSTGRPKGVMIPHRGVVRLVKNTDYAEFGEREVFLQFAPVSFDASTLEIWGPLLNGGTLVLMPAGGGTVEEIGDQIRTRGVTTLWLTSGLFNVMVDERLEDLSGLKQLLVGGDVLSVPHVKRAMEGLKGCRLINGYGPTENTTFTCCHRIEAKDVEGASIPIGRPIGNTRVYILDERMEPVPPGVWGELYAGGDGLGLGYLNQDGLTAERFVKDPFGGETGGRLYKTGDVCRWRDDGVIEFQGRKDTQVKVRGYRIELGEIEACLGGVEGVREGVVLALGEGSDQKRLVGFVVTRKNEGSEASIEAVKEGLRSRLPGYMVPELLVSVEALPLSPNGKVDRIALARMGRELRVETRAYETPRAGMEETLARVWQEVLGVERVGRTDAFFELGGHSLLALRMLAAVNRALGVSLSVSSVFENPCLADLAALAERVWNSGGTLKAPGVEPLRPRAVDSAPFSRSQSQLWFFEQLNPETAAYTVPDFWRLEGQLKVDVLIAAIETVVERQGALRTVFYGGDPEPRQRRISTAEFRVKVEEVIAEDVDAARTKAHQMAVSEARRAFQIEGHPLFRVRLLRLAAEEHWLLVNAHHAITDGWSVALFLDEVAEVYRALIDGKPPGLPALPVQYLDFADWQQSAGSCAGTESDLNFWNHYLAGAPEVIDLPLEKARPSVPRFDGDQVSVQLPTTILSALESLSRSEQVTPFMTLLALSQCLLARYTGGTDIVVGTPSAGRDQPEVEGLIGYFVNMLVLRTQVDDRESFRSQMNRTKASAVGAYAHQNYRFERLVQELCPQRNLAVNPVFQVAVLYERRQDSMLALPGIECRSIPSFTETSKFDLSLIYRESAEGLQLVIEYSLDLFSRRAMERMLRHLETLLRCVLADPDRSLRSLTLAAPSEVWEWTEGFNATTREYLRESTIQEVFEAEASRRPEAVALIAGDERMTYRELSERSEALASRLVEAGVVVGSKVAVCLERSPELIVALLGILKAGGAYVPLSPEYPVERLEWMLEDTQAPVLLTEQSLSGRLPVTKARVLLKEEWCVELTPGNAHSERLRVEGLGAKSVAYVMYTSGSTGRPKGVMIPHRGVVRLVKNTDYAEFGEKEVFLQFAPVSFDASTLEIWGPLLNGGTLVLMSAGGGTVEEIGDQIRTRGVTTLWLTSGLFNVMVDERLGDLSGLKQLLVGGDVLSVPHVKRAMEGLKGCRLINGYGPTENTTFTCCHRIEAKDVEGASIPIGRPIGNTRVYILDERMEPVPPGVWGELYAGGDGLGLGYLNQDELTAEKFVRDPFGANECGRLYKTGDVCRWREDGVIEFQGRKDTQVKVRGYRIELGEIEALLGGLEGVREGVVLALGEGSDQKRLVAFVVMREDTGSTASVEAVKEGLRRRLPGYMLPETLVKVDALPLSSNGKVDRKELARLGLEMKVERRAYEAPRTAMEETLAGVWRGVLGVERVGRNDHFFEIGGHSLLALRMLAAVNRVVELSLPVAVVFENPRLSDLAAFAEQVIQECQGETENLSDATSVESRRDADRSRPRARGVDVGPLSHSQSQLWFFEQLNPGTSTYSVPDFWRVNGGLRIECLITAIQSVVARQGALRTVFVNGVPEPTQRMAPAQELRVHVEEIAGETLEVKRTRAEAIASAEACRGFQIEGGSLFRVRLLRLDPQEHWLLVNAHHAITDGWSASVFLREVGEMYRALVAGQSPGWLPLPLQFPDYADWQRSTESSAGSPEDLHFWKRYLAGAPEIIDLPLEHARPVIPSFRGGKVEMGLPHSVVSALESLSRRERVTPFMTLLALSQWLLARYTGTNDIVVGTPSAGRDQTEVEGLIGYFVNMLVLRTQVDDHESFRSQMRRTSESAVGAYAHQKYRFEHLVKELCPQRSAAVNPLFQVAVLHERRQDSMLTLPGLECSPIPIFTQTSKFDLSLIYRESAEGLQLVIEYSLDLFSRRAMERMLRHLETLLHSVLADPDRSLRSLTLAAPSEVREWTEGFNATTREYPRELTIQEVFETEVARRPDAVALIAGERRMTYRELSERSEALARRLMDSGVMVGSRVAVCLERSPELIVALLGILKAGGAYVPLSPEYPVERLEWMLEDTQAPVLLTERSLSGRLPVTKARVWMKEEWWTDRGVPGGELGRRGKLAGLDAKSVAYVMYTSGSTGRPKGVMIPHRGVVRLVKNTDYAEFGEKEVFLQFAPVSFDASTLEIWGPLLNGGTLVLMPAGGGTVEEIGEQIRTHGVTTLWLTSGLFNVMVDERLEDLSGLKQLLVGGDVLSVPHVKRAMEGLKGCRLINGYGPTENTTFTCCHRIEAVDLSGSAIPIGKPIGNTKVYVLNERMEPVPPGVWGELYAGGDGLGVGYLNQDELTAERFVRDPFGGETGGRLYKTGDVCRWRDDGVIEFQGRKDTQVKVRGYRIELGEIEACLGGLEGVREGVVLALGEGIDQKRLVAFVVMREDTGSTASVEAVKEVLRSRLPGYMVPETLVKVDALPLSPNGKVDRKELARLGRDLRRETRAFEPPQTEMEETLAGLWREVLGVERVGRNDPFFEIGGHSLLALKLFSRMNEVLGRKLPLATLFRAPTVAKLAALVESEEESNKGWSSLVPIRPAGDWPPFFCVHGGGGEVLFAQDLLKYLDPRLPFYGLQARGLDDPEKRDETIEQMAEHYVEEILSVADSGPIYLGGYCMGGMIAYEMARRLVRSGRTIGLLLMIDSYNPDYMRAWVDREDPKKLWVQKLMFQAGNLWRLPVRDSLAYLVGRSGAALARRSQWLANSVAKLFGNAKAEEEKGAFDPVRNEAESLLISRKYHPEPSQLDVLLFRPDSCFTGLEDPQMGWGGVVQGKLDVVSLPVNPGGMLVEPFVGILGKEMNRRFVPLHDLTAPSPNPGTSSKAIQEGSR